MTSNEDKTPTLSRAAKITLVLGVILLAAGLRFLDLEQVGPHGDEDLTAFAVQSLKETGVSMMPSGMRYGRGITYHRAAAQVEELTGISSPYSARYVSAFYGTLTVALVTLLLGPVIGWRLAILVGVALALSSWHIYTSRTARFYSELTLWTWLAFFSAYKASTAGFRGPWLGAFVICASVAAFVHELGIFSLGFLGAGLLISGKRPRDFGVAATCAVLVSGVWIFAVFRSQSAFAEGSVSESISEEPSSSDGLYGEVVRRVSSELNAVVQPATSAIDSLPTWLALLALTIVLLLRTGAGRALIAPWTIAGAAVNVSFGFGLMLLAASQLYGAALLLSIALLSSRRYFDLSMQHRRNVLAALAVGGACAFVTAYFFSDLGLYHTLKVSTAIPRFHPLSLIEELPTLCAAVSLACVALLLIGRADEHMWLRYSLAAALVYLVLLGVGLTRSAPRYLFGVLPVALLAAVWLLMLLACVITAVLRTRAAWAPGSHKHVPVGIALALVASGLLGGTGLIPAWSVAFPYHPANLLPSTAAAYPDHRGAAFFVAHSSAPDDMIIAADASQMVLHLGSIDYWLINEESHRHLLYENPADGRLRDRYTNVVVMTEVEIDEVMADPRRAWLITSAETVGFESHYMTAAQRQWVAMIRREHARVFLGKDGTTAVYCIRPESAHHECPAEQTD